MTATLEALGIDRMTIAERVALVQEILETIAAEQEAPPMSEDLKAELRRRVAAHRANPDSAIPWEQIKADAYARFAK